MAAWLLQENGVWKIGFRWEGKLYKRSLKTKDESRANGLKERASANLFDLEQGRLQVPPGSDLLTFLLTDGKKTERKVPSAKPLTFEGLFDGYEAAMPSGAKSKNTLDTEKVHRKHILRIFGEQAPVRSHRFKYVYNPPLLANSNAAIFQFRLNHYSFVIGAMGKLII
jgi:hypothetical protein